MTQPCRRCRYLAPLAVIAGGIAILTGCNGSGNGSTPVGAAPVTATDSRLYVAGNLGNQILSFNNADTVSGTIIPERALTGAATTLTGPRGLAIDMPNNVLYVANAGGNAVLAFTNARSATGNTAPARTIAGAATTFNLPSGLYYDTAHDRLYVANTGGNSVLVFDGIGSANGNMAPTRTLAGGNTTFSSPGGIALDATRNKLYVSNAGANAILVFDNADSVLGDTAPSRTIVGVITLLSTPGGIYIDVLADRLYIANTGNNSIVIIHAANAVSGNLTPNRLLSGGATMLNQPRDLFLDSGTDRLYVANTGGNSVLIYNSAGLVDGNAAPSRTLNLPAGTAPRGLFVDVTPIVLGSTASLDGHVLSDGTALTAGGGPRTGDLDSFLVSTSARQFYSFALDNIPAGVSVVNASLRLYQAQVTGQPYSDLGSVAVDHINYGASLTSNDYLGGTLASNIGTLSTTTATEYKVMDVSSRVSADLTAARVRSQYRLRFRPLESNTDGSDDYVQFTDAEDSCCNVNKPPQLVITVLP